MEIFMGSGQSRLLVAQGTAQSVPTFSQSKYSIEILKKENYINKILNRFNFEKTETLERINKIREVSNDFINQKCV